MSETKFTPGPWSVDLEDAQHDYIIWCPKGTFLANTGNGRGMVVNDERETIAFDVSKANAALMASAPDLYAALEEVEDMIDAGWISSDYAEEWNAHAEKMRAALKKARGES